MKSGGARAITTAGHCGNSQSYAGNPLAYNNDEVRTTSDDEQSHSKSGAIYRNRIYVGGIPGYRDITSKKTRSQQNIGDFVCKYGKATGWGCGWIVSKTAPPCGGVGAPANTAIRVDSDPNGAGYDLSAPGDSGGPFVVGNTALGGMSCQLDFDAIYVAVDYIESGLGATILTSP